LLKSFFCIRTCTSETTPFLTFPPAFGTMSLHEKTNQANTYRVGAGWRRCSLFGTVDVQH
jgi:hypothetical protein